MHLFRRKPTDEDSDTRRRPLRQAQSQPRMGPNRTFSYHANRSVNDAATGREPDAVSERAQPTTSKLQRMTRRLLLVMVSLVLLAVLINELSLSAMPKVVPLSSATSRVFLRDNIAYQQAAAVLFRHIGNRNKLTVNTAAISSGLLQKFPELSAVSVSLPVLGHRPVVYVQPSTPSMVFVTEGDSAGSFVLDSNGKALLRDDNQMAQLTSLQVPTVVDQNPLNITTGQVALPTTSVHFIQTVVAQLGAQHIHFTSIVLPKAASELDVQIAGKPFYVKFNTEDNSPLQQVGTFIAVYKHLQAQGITPHRYIDVRIDGRAYYK